MPGTSSVRWIALFAAFAASLAGMALMTFGSTPTLRGLGIGIFVAGAAVYLATRISMMRRR